MTREDNFHATFVPQLVAYGVYKFTTPLPLSKLPPSAFPSFSLEFGLTKYTDFDFTGKATHGEQLFDITFYLTIGENQYGAFRTLRSDTINTIEQFINAPIYIPPTLAPGDLYSIDTTELVSVGGWRYSVPEARISVTIHAQYNFTLY